MRATLAAVMAFAALAIMMLAPAVDSDGAADGTIELHKLDVKFTSTCTDTLYIVWDFGDGTGLDGRWEHYKALADSGTEFTNPQIVNGLAAYRTALEAAGGSIDEPVHTYAQAGSYTPTVTAINPIGWTHGGQTYTEGSDMDIADFDGGLFSTSSASSDRGSWDTKDYRIEIVLDGTGESVGSEKGWVSEWLPWIIVAIGIALAVVGLVFHPVIIIAGAAVVVVGALEILGWINLV